MENLLVNRRYNKDIDYPPLRFIRKVESIRVTEKSNDTCESSV